MPRLFGVRYRLVENGCHGVDTMVFRRTDGPFLRSEISLVNFLAAANRKNPTRGDPNLGNRRFRYIAGSSWTYHWIPSDRLEGD